MVDFGGGAKDLLHFKMKFKPVKIYKTYNYTMVPLADSLPAQVLVGATETPAINEVQKENAQEKNVT